MAPYQHLPFSIHLEARLTASTTKMTDLDVGALKVAELK